MGKKSEGSDGNVFRNKTESSDEKARRIISERKAERKRKFLQEKEKNKVIPSYLENCVERCQILLSNNHTDPDLYSLPELYYFSDICSKQKRNEMFENHILDSSFISILHSSDEKTHKKAVDNYNKTVEKFTNG